MSGYEVLHAPRREGQDADPDPVGPRRHRRQGEGPRLRRGRLSDEAVSQGRARGAHPRDRPPLEGHAQSVITTGDLVVNLDTKTVEVSGSRVPPARSTRCWNSFLRKGTTLTKEMFLNHLYGGMDEPELKIIDVFICKPARSQCEPRQELHRRCGAAATCSANRPTRTSVSRFRLAPVILARANSQASAWRGAPTRITAD